MFFRIKVKSQQTASMFCAACLAILSSLYRRKLIIPLKTEETDFGVGMKRSLRVKGTWIFSIKEQLKKVRLGQRERHTISCENSEQGYWLDGLRWMRAYQQPLWEGQTRHREGQATSEG